MCSSTMESAPKDETIARSSGRISVAWRRTETPSSSSNMPLSDMMPSWRSGLVATAALGIAIERLLERLLAEAAESGDERLVVACAPGDIGVDQPLDSVRHVFRNETVAEDVADRSVLGGVAADGDLIELGA